MPSARRVAPAYALLAELCTWYGMAGMFLVVYVRSFHGPLASVLPHLGAFSMLLIAVFCARILVYGMVSAPNAHGLSVVLVTTAFLLSVGYYALVLIGLASWGRVVSQELLLSYWRQLPDLLHVLGVEPLLIAALALVGFAAIILGMHWLLRRFDWTRDAASHFTRRFSWLLVLVILIWSSIQFLEYVRHAPATSGDPLAMTFSTARRDLPAVERRRGGPEADRRESDARSLLTPTRQIAGRNVILIVVDALRPANMAAYGYVRDTTPFLSRLMREGRITLVRDMRASCAESSCGLTSMFASRFVHQLPNRPISLHQLLKLNGYRIHLILGGDHANFYGLADEYGEVDHFLDGSSVKGYYMNDDQYVVDQTERLATWDGRPVFFQYHLMSAHQLGLRRPESQRFLPSSNYTRRDGNDGSEAYANFYDNGVLQTDRVIERILTALAARNYLKDALVLVTADHGEGLGENGVFSHGKGISEPVVRIPFMAVQFGGSRQIDFHPDNVVPAQIDIAPTLLHELNIPAPATWEGRPLQLPGSRRTLWMEQHPHYGLIELDHSGQIWKFVHRQDNGVETLHELKSDPNEARDQVGRIPLQQRTVWRSRLPLTQQ